MIKPMLAAKDLQDLTKLTFPILASPKIDGIRAIIHNNKVLSRRLKPIPNKHIQKMLQGMPNGLDGELIVGRPNHEQVFSNTQSGVMSIEGKPTFTFHIFDYISADCYTCRQDIFKRWYKDNGHKYPVKLVKQTLIHNIDELEQYEKRILKRGYEGVMLRSLDGFYKFGRSTLREHYLLKLKRFLDSEAIILNTIELMHNDNELKRDATGKAKRSSHKANMRPGNTLGSLSVRDIHTGVSFELGTGFTDELRKELWLDKKNLKGMIVRYKYFPVGIKEKPRHPTFLGFRKD